MNATEFPINLYCLHVVQVNTIDLCRGNDDFRKVYIVDDGKRKIVIKHCSNSFTDENRINGWFRLMEAYRAIGIYCPSIVPNQHGELIHRYTVDGRDYFVFAEEFAKYDTAEKIGKENLKDSDGNFIYLPDMMRSLGKVASARPDMMDWPSSYCLLEPYAPPDTVDETTECAVLFTDYIKENLPELYDRAQSLLTVFYQNKKALKRVYDLLPTACFQGDLNASNVLLDGEHKFVGLIDFNLCGREPILNYTIREALWGVEDACLYNENGDHLYLYDRTLNAVHDRSFLKNIGYIQEYYEFSETERKIFPILFRYMNSFWWHHVREIKKIKEDKEKVTKLLDWLEYQMTRDDIRLP